MPTPQGPEITRMPDLEPADLRAAAPVQTAQMAAAHAPITIDSDGPEHIEAPFGKEAVLEEVMANAPKLRRVPLDSPGGKLAVEAALREADMEPSPLAVEFFTENWLHPRLAEWGRENGFVSSIDQDIKLSSRVGHFDHAPYALTSTFGTTVHPTPFQTAKHGRVFMVEWDSRAKAYEIATRVQFAAKEFAKDFEAQSRLRASYFPPRNMDDYSLSHEILREVSEVREGFSIGRGCGNSREYGLGLIDSAKEALTKLQAGGLVARVQGARGYSEEAKASMLKALASLKELAPVLQQCRSAWLSEIRAREAWTRDLRAKYSSDTVSA